MPYVGELLIGHSIVTEVQIRIMCLDIFDTTYKTFI